MLRALGWLKTALIWWRRADAVIDTVDDFITGGDNAESDRRRYSGNAHDRRKAAREESRQAESERERGAVLELPSVQETGKQILSKLRSRRSADENDKANRSTAEGAEEKPV